MGLGFWAFLWGGESVRLAPSSAVCLLVLRSEEALRAAKLYVNEKKTKLFCSEEVAQRHITYKALDDASGAAVRALLSGLHG